jgi:signal transduction histidine kinase
MRPRARLISLIGDELISDEPVAVVELVKNAYDADATRVDITFRGENPLAPDELVIKDDGVGMSLDTVLTGWLEPGTIKKKLSDSSPSGRRIFQGAKGVGRFAAARLATSLYMETKLLDQKDGVTVLLEWGRFDDASYLDEVEIDYEVRPLPQLEHGTCLTLMGLRGRRVWSDDDYQALHDRLSRLVSPFLSTTGQEEVKDFAINLTIPGHPELTGKVEAHALTRRPKYRLAGKLDDMGAFTGVLEIDGRPPKPYEHHALGGKDDTVACGPFDIEIRAWDRDRKGLASYMTQFALGLSQVRGILDRYCGVSLYRDGFRVHPYGEQGNDWAELDHRSRQNPTMNLANNQVIAAIRISRLRNLGLKDRTTREGLVHNDAYGSLKIWFGHILKLLEEERYRVRPREETQPPEVTTIFEAFDMSEVVHQADQQLGPHHPLAQLVRKKDAVVREAIRNLQEHYSRVMLAAGFGQMVDTVVHEIGAPLGRANRELSRLEKDLQATVGDYRATGLAHRITNIKAHLEQIFNCREMLMPKTAGRRGRATTFSVQDEIEGNLGLFEGLLAKQGIKPRVHAPRAPLLVHMSRSVLGQVIANLLDNSIYWLYHHHGEGKGGQIDIRLAKLKRGFRLTISDDGPGVAQEDRERMFDMNFTRKPNGMGLGLFIARQVIEPYGTLAYRDDGELPGACFEALFENKVDL